MQPNQQPQTPSTEQPAAQPPVAQPTPSANTVGGLKPMTPENMKKSLRTAWLFGAGSIIALVLGIFVTSIAAPLGAILGAWALYIGMRLKQKGLIVIGSIGLLNLVVYLIVVVANITAG